MTDKHMIERELFCGNQNEQMLEVVQLCSTSVPCYCRAWRWQAGSLVNPATNKKGERQETEMIEHQQTGLWSRLSTFLSPDLMTS